MLALGLACLTKSAPFGNLIGEPWPIGYSCIALYQCSRIKCGIYIPVRFILTLQTQSSHSGGVRFIENAAYFLKYTVVGHYLELIGLLYWLGICLHCCYVGQYWVRKFLPAFLCKHLKCNFFMPVTYCGNCLMCVCACVCLYVLTCAGMPSFQRHRGLCATVSQDPDLQ